MKRSFFIILAFILTSVFPSNVFSQDNSAEVIRQFRRTVFKLQQEMLEMKEQFDEQEKELKAQKETLALEVEILNTQNNQLRTQLLEQSSLLLQLEDRLESSAIVKLTKDLENLRDFNKALILFRLDYPEQSEKLLLDIINQPDTSLPKDLLILLLAQQKWQLKSYDDALSYYSTLLSEFFGSPYFSQAIFEMSEVFGELEKPEQQITLLSQLSALSDTDRYSLKAADKLIALGSEPLEAGEEEEIALSDSTADIEELLAEVTPDTTADTTTDLDQVIVEAATDMTSDIAAIQSTDDATADQPTETVDGTSDTAPAEAMADLPDEPKTVDASPDSMVEIERDIVDTDPTSDIDSGSNESKTPDIAQAPLVEQKVDETSDTIQIAPASEQAIVPITADSAETAKEGQVTIPTEGIDSTPETESLVLAEENETLDESNTPSPNEAVDDEKDLPVESEEVKIATPIETEKKNNEPSEETAASAEEDGGISEESPEKTSNVDESANEESAPEESTQDTSDQVVDSTHTDSGEAPTNIAADEAVNDVTGDFMN